MNKSVEFEKYRSEYKEFFYNSYSITDEIDAIYIEYDFEIPNLTKFKPNIRILKKDFKFKNLDSKQIENMVFHIGMVELISYWKCTCSPYVVVRCGYLNEEQISWWKKLYFYGLGELFYANKIQTTLQDFMEIKCTDSSNMIEYEKIEEEFDGYIIPVGGGKDSVVTLEALNSGAGDNYALIINPKPTTLKCAEIAGFKDNKIIEIYRTIDKNLIDLNSKGFINGHTPFSAIIAFVSYFASYLLSKRYIALSNENSANESNVVGKRINHQYSKSFEFECDFVEYSQKYLKAPITYFSFLRPLNELQIAKTFAKYDKYHKVFKSCNLGSKGNEWQWCCECAKCLYAYIILSPYLYKEKLIDIFGMDLFEKEELLSIFNGLIGKGANKPFECVGTYEEVNFAISKTIVNIIDADMELPYLLQYYKDNYGLVDTSEDITKRYNLENNLTEEQTLILRKEVF